MSELSLNENKKFKLDLNLNKGTPSNSLTQSRAYSPIKVQSRASSVFANKFQNLETKVNIIRSRGFSNRESPVNDLLTEFNISNAK